MLTSLLPLVRTLGGFHVARALTKSDLRILCYHGFSVDDEHRFEPSMFMSRAVFADRLDRLIAGGYQVLPLPDAVARLRAGTLPPLSVVITIDDGFYGTYLNAVPELLKRKLPATIYLTTYHVQHQEPTFPMALSYVFWKSSRDAVDLSGLGLDPAIAPDADLRHLPRAALRALAHPIIRFAATREARSDRTALLAAIAARCGVDFDAINRGRLFHLMNADEVAEVSKEGIDIELHTHRHRSWGVESVALTELRDNAAAIESIIGQRPRHFCYPSGRYDRYKAEWLAAAGVLSATTCVTGFARRSDSPFLLGRFTDSDALSPLVFDAELAGVKELARRVKHRLKRPAEVFEDDPGEGRPESLQPVPALQSVFS